MLRVGQVREERGDDGEVRPRKPRAADVVPEQQRDHDERDQRQDEIGLAEMRSLEPLRPDDLADDGSGHDADEHEHGEGVGEVAVPLRRAHVPAGDVDRRQDDRREENDEAPEDERVHQAGDEPLQQLPLAEHDLDLVLDPLLDVGRAVVGLRAPYLLGEEPGPPREAAARRDDEDRERDRSYDPRTFRSSALIAGTTSCRSPMTA